MSRVLVTGDREWKNLDVIHLVLDLLQPTSLIHGAASGADEIAGQWAYLNNVDCYSFPARWYEHDFQGETFLECFGFGQCKEGSPCKLAGPRRNREMLYMTNPDIVIAFHDYILKSKGTKDMTKIALDQNIMTLLYFTFTPVGPKYPLFSCVELFDISDDIVECQHFDWVKKAIKE